MRRMAWVATWLLVLGIGAAQAQTRAWLDRDRIESGDTATLNIETDQPGAEPPDYAALLADFDVSGHSSRRSHEIVNGQRRQRSLFGVALMPRREGVLTVPALRVGNAVTAPLSLTVLPASTAPARAGEPAFIEAEVDSQSPYVHQSVGYVLRLYYATPLVSGQLDQPPPEGASLQRVGSDLQYTRDVAGRRYTVVERRFQLVPERSGTLTVPGARFEGRGVGGFFDDMLGSTRRELRANGPPQVLQVRAMPDAAPQPWLPLHGLELRYLEAPQSARVGEAVTVVVEAVADGGTGTQLPALELEAGDGAQVFAEPAQIDETFDNGRLRSRITRRFSVLPAQPGALRIAGPRLAWWDVRGDRSRTASLPDLQWQVAAGTGSGATMVPVDSLEPAAAASRASSGWRWLTLLFAVLWLGTLAWALRGRVPGRWRRAAQVTGVPAPETDPVIAGRTSPRQVMQVLQVGDLGEVATALCAMVTPPAEDLDALAARLDDPAQREAIALLQRARWGDGDPIAARDAVREAFRQGVAPARAPARQEDPLPPLYPRQSPQ